MINISISEYPFVFVHRKDCDGFNNIGCDGEAFYLKEKLQVDDPLTAENIIGIHGELICGGDPILCYSCNQPLGDLKVDNILKRKNNL